MLALHGESAGEGKRSEPLLAALGEELWAETETMAESDGTSRIRVLSFSPQLAQRCRGNRRDLAAQRAHIALAVRVHAV